MDKLILYKGLVVLAANRVYNFSVNGSGVEPRKFTVEIGPESFISTQSFSAQLKFQDGPSISLLRLKREIEHENPDCPAKSHLTISGQDVEDYLTTQYPKKAVKKRVACSGPAPTSGRP
jgi:hypothetical protein